MRLSVVRCARRCRVKKTLFATTLVLALSLTAAGQKKLAASQHLAGSSEETVLALAGTPPGLWSPCLFSGGGPTVFAFHAAGLLQENTNLIPGRYTFSC